MRFIREGEDKGLKKKEVLFMEQDVDCQQMQSDELIRSRKDCISISRLDELVMDWKEMDKEAKKYYPFDMEGELNFKIDWLKHSLRNTIELKDEEIEVEDRKVCIRGVKFNLPYKLEARKLENDRRYADFISSDVLPSFVGMYTDNMDVIHSYYIVIQDGIPIVIETVYGDITEGWMAYECTIPIHILIEGGLQVEDSRKVEMEEVKKVKNSGKGVKLNFPYQLKVWEYENGERNCILIGSNIEPKYMGEYKDENGIAHIYTMIVQDELPMVIEVVIYEDGAEDWLAFECPRLPLDESCHMYK